MAPLVSAPPSRIRVHARVAHDGADGRAATAAIPGQQAFELPRRSDHLCEVEQQLLERAPAQARTVLLRRAVPRGRAASGRIRGTVQRYVLAIFVRRETLLLKVLRTIANSHCASIIVRIDEREAPWSGRSILANVLRVRAVLREPAGIS